MDKRLEKIKSYIKNGIGIIDVGTDHGYLPINLAKNGYLGNIIASDINYEPLMTAVKNAHEADVYERIDFIQSDGLLKCNPDLVDTIVIAGMGGDLICNIMDYADWTMSPRYSLILQPMTKSEVLRYWLVNNGYNILHDEIVSAGDKDYFVLNVRYYGTNQIYSDAELFVGKNPNERVIRKAIKSIEKKPKHSFYSPLLIELKEKLANDSK